MPGAGRARPWPVTAAAIVFTVAALVLAAAYACVDVTYALASPYDTDFAGYYAFAWQAVHSGWPALYDLAAQHRAYAALGPIWFFPNNFPPAMAFLVLPFLALPLVAAYAAWTLVVLAGTGLAWFLLAPASPLARIAHLAAYLSAWATALGLVLGQVVGIQAGALAVAQRLLARRADTAAGLVLAVAAVKPQTLLLVPLCLLVAGRWRAVAALAAAAVAITAVTLALVHPSGVLAWYVRLSESSADPVASFVPVQLVVPFQLRHAGLGALAPPFQLLCALAAAVAAWRHRGGGEEIGLAAALTASLLLSPFVHLQDLVMLFVAGWLALRGGLPVWAWPALGGCYVGLLGLGFEEFQPWAPPLTIVSECALLACLAVMPRRGAAQAPASITPRSRPAQ